MPSRPRVARVLPAVVAVLAALAFAVPAANAATVTGTKTTLTIDGTTYNALAAAHIYAYPLAPAQLEFLGIPKIHFPITGGFVEPLTMLGTENLAGGLMMVQYDAQLTTPQKSLKTTDLKILNGLSLVGTPQLLDGSPLNLPSAVADLKNIQKTTSGSTITYSADWDLTLVSALALNVYFGTGVFQPGMKLGRAVSTITTT